MLWWQNGDINPTIHTTLPLSGFKQAMQLIKARNTIVDGLR